MKLLSLLSLVVFFIVPQSWGQPWLDSLPFNKSKSELTFTDMRNAFEAYWKPFQVVNGYYVLNGQKKKAVGWKQFKRWENQMQCEIDVTTGQFSSSSAAEIAKKYHSHSVQNKSELNDNWISLGPNKTDYEVTGLGRTSCITFHPNDAKSYWVGTAGAGLWYFDNSLSKWTSLTDNVDYWGVNDVVVPANYASSKTIYIALGDKAFGAQGRSSGVLKSTDGGLTWNKTGLVFPLNQYNNVYRLLMDPTDSQTLLAATMKGVFKTTDGGVTWNTKLTATDFRDLECNPENFNILYGSTANGQIHRSVNGGVSWTNVYTNNTAREIEMTVNPSQPNMVFAVSGNSNYGLHAVLKSSDNGSSFESIYLGTTKNLLSRDVDGLELEGLAWYAITIAVSPTNPDEIYVGGINLWKSTDGGNTFQICTHWVGDNGHPIVHADKHFHTFDRNGNLFECNDGGIFKTEDRGQTWTNLTQGMCISQMYRIGVSQQNDDYNLAGLQDNGTYIIDETQLFGNIIGGDGMECLINPVNDDIQFASYQNGVFYKTDDKWLNMTELEISTLAGQGTWTTPMVMDPQNPAVLYAGYAELWKSSDNGDSWSQISDFRISAKISHIDVAATDNKVIYLSIGTRVKKTVDGGMTWKDASGNLPISTNISCIKVKNNDLNTVWITFSEYGSSRIFETTNGGQTWKSIATGLPNIPVYTVVQDIKSTEPHLFVGTSVGVYYKSGADNWVLFSKNLPKVPVYDLEIYYGPTAASSKLKAGTFGRGLWETSYPEFNTNALGEVLTVSKSVFKIYPNPTQGKVSISYTMASAKSVDIQLIDLNGKICYQENAICENGVLAKEIDFKKQRKGEYILKLTSDTGKSLSDKLVICD